jgi:hypothetical protein
MSSTTVVNEQPTLASIWQTVAEGTIDEEVLAWPPDLFALTHVLLERSEAHRFALSPPNGSSWPPEGFPEWAAAVAEAGRCWGAWIEDRDRGIPDLLAEEWAVMLESTEMPLAELAEGHDWRACEALLTLHAIADEACAGLGVALTASHGVGSLYRARGRELLARTGSLARIPPHLLRVLPKIRTSPRGTSARALSRYASVHAPGVDARWYKVHARRPGIEPQAQHVNFLLLPWPLRVRESDFRPIEGSVRSLATEPFGFFEFAPSQGLDLDLADRVLVAARDEVDKVDVVWLPESAIEESEVDDLEGLLASHGVFGLIAGVRARPEQRGQLRPNWVHIGVSTGEEWVHLRQNKHHRWSLDEQQVYQYHLGGALHPHVRWWDAMEVPRRCIQFVEGSDGVTLASLACEDLAQIDDLADVLRSVGPTMVVTPLLDGPQLSSRWAARYASVLADDPGSAVLTLTSAGMTRRSRPHGRDASPVVALWKDPARGAREVSLESGAQGILLTASSDLTTRRSGDGRSPVENCTEFFDVSVYQVRAASTGSGFPRHRRDAPTETGLPAAELTILMSWAEAVSEALACAPERVGSVLADARPDAPWRAVLGIATPSAELTEALDFADQAVRDAIGGTADPTPDVVLFALRERPTSERALDRLAQRVLRSALEQRESRQAKQGQVLATNGSLRGSRLGQPTADPR